MMNLKFLSSALTLIAAAEGAAIETDSKERVKGPQLRGVAAAVQSLVGAPANSKTLTVTIKRATDLEGEDTFGDSDPYVILELEQNNWMGDVDLGEARTTTKDGLSPVWDESFQFLVDDLTNVELELTVWDEDTGGFDDEMGDCTIKLDDEGLSAAEKEVSCVIDSHTFSSDEKLYVGLSYA